MTDLITPFINSIDKRTLYYGSYDSMRYKELKRPLSGLHVTSSKEDAQNYFTNLNYDEPEGSVTAIYADVRNTNTDPSFIDVFLFKDVLKMQEAIKAMQEQDFDSYKYEIGTEDVLILFKSVAIKNAITGRAM